MYQIFRILRRAEGKNFKFENLQEKQAEPFHHVFYSFFVAMFHTHFYKPVYPKKITFFTFDKPLV